MLFNIYQVSKLETILPSGLTHIESDSPKKNSCGSASALECRIRANLLISSPYPSKATAHLIRHAVASVQPVARLRETSPTLQLSSGCTGRYEAPTVARSALAPGTAGGGAERQEERAGQGIGEGQAGRASSQGWWGIPSGCTETQWWTR